MLHNDFKLDNTMVGDGGDLTAVLDWDMATLGDPLVDLGTLLAYWVDPEGPTYPDLRGAGGHAGPGDAPLSVIAAYAGATGFDLAPDPLLRGAGAVPDRGDHRADLRALPSAGQTTDPRFARFEPIAPILAAAAVATLAG